VTKQALKYFDVRAAIIFIAAHYLTIEVHNLLVIGDNFVIPRGGFILCMLQAAIFVSLLFLKIKFELAIAAGVTSIFYVFMAINWAFMSRWDEIAIQTYFYDTFPSIIMTMNIIVIFLLGKDGGIYIFNKLFKHHPFYNKTRLFFRTRNYNNIRNINLPIRNSNIKSQEICK
jgi:hypothetical protein